MTVLRLGFRFRVDNFNHLLAPVVVVVVVVTVVVVATVAVVVVRAFVFTTPGMWWYGHH